MSIRGENETSGSLKEPRQRRETSESSSHQKRTGSTFRVCWSASRDKCQTLMELVLAFTRQKMHFFFKMILVLHRSRKPRFYASYDRGIIRHLGPLRNSSEARWANVIMDDALVCHVSGEYLSPHTLWYFPGERVKFQRGLPRIYCAALKFGTIVNGGIKVPKARRVIAQKEYQGSVLSPFPQLRSGAISPFQSKYCYILPDKNHETRKKGMSSKKRSTYFFLNDEKSVLSSEIFDILLFVNANDVDMKCCGKFLACTLCCWSHIFPSQFEGQRSLPNQ